MQPLLITPIPCITAAGLNRTCRHEQEKSGQVWMYTAENCARTEIMRLFYEQERNNADMTFVLWETSPKLMLQKCFRCESAFSKLIMDAN